MKKIPYQLELYALSSLANDDIPLHPISERTPYLYLLQHAIPSKIN